MKEDIRERVIEGIDDDLIRDAYSPENAVASPSAKRRFIGLKRAALVAAAAVLTVCGLLMLNENVRAAVFGSFLRRSGKVVEVYFADPDAESGSDGSVSVYGVTLGYIPDGLITEESEVTEDGIKFVYLQVEPGDEGRHEPYVSVAISRSGVFPWGFGGGNYDDYVYQSSVNGMDAYMFDYSDLPARFEFRAEGGQILFGDENITVCVNGTGLSFDEVVKIAENIKW